MGRQDIPRSGVKSKVTIQILGGDALDATDWKLLPVLYHHAIGSRKRPNLPAVCELPLSMICERVPIDNGEDGITASLHRLANVTITMGESKGQGRTLKTSLFAFWDAGCENWNGSPTLRYAITDDVAPVYEKLLEFAVT